MRNRASFVLMEGLVMLLVFALAAAICLQVFVAADTRSQKTSLQTDALALAQNGAEAMKAADGDLTEAAALLGGEVTENTLILRADGLILEIIPQSASVPGLGTGVIRVSSEDSGACLYTLTAGWQEVAQ